MIKFRSLVLFTLFSISIFAQSSSNILADLQKFNSFKTVLYLAAHPDDENTRVISWLVNGEHAETGYLSLTRGDGGQNLIGDELGPQLGILRTQELLAARSIDGGKQFFSRAVDFGYSRSADETLEKWGEEEVLADVVWVIRKFKPQLIITRFPPDERAGHGHHTASAMLAIKAVEAAKDENQFAEQLEFVAPWEVQSVYWNGSLWWDKDLQKDYENEPAIWRADIGGYDPLTGISYNELGSLARSQHKCQGFGVDIQRGESFEYFRPLAGNELPEGLQSLETPDWKKLGVPKVQPLYANLLMTFDPFHPEESLPQLAEIYKQLYNIKDEYWRNRKLEECKAIMLKSAGFFAEALVDDFAYSPGSVVPITVNFLSRQSSNLSIDGIRCQGGGLTFKAAASLPKNQFVSYQVEGALPDEVTNPYWLKNDFGDLYDVKNQNLIGQPQNKPLIEVSTNVMISGMAVPVSIPVKYKWRDRVEGELQREIVAVPPVAVNFKQPMSISINGAPVEVEAAIKWFNDSIDRSLKFSASGWKVEVLHANANGETVQLKAKNSGSEEVLKLRLTPLQNATQAELKVSVDEEMLGRGYQEIAYSHIPTQVYQPEAKMKLTAVSLSTFGEKVAYIVGAGDRVAEGIAQMGYQVDVLSAENLANTDLSQYQAVVIGIRGYNTQAWLKNYSEQFFEYVKNGGNFIVQYNTASRFLQDAADIPAPFEYKIGRGRVTEEDSEVEFLLPKHPVLNAPNKISKTDFDGWVQERGLYFAAEWDDTFKTPIGWADKGQAQERGGLLIANVGQGAYIYTGISFFRELPAGVPGAYRLLANLISYSQK